MMHRLGTALSAIALLSACGGGGGSGGSNSGTVTPPPTGVVTPPPPPPPPVAAAGCSLRERQQFVGDTIYQTYLFPETLPADRTPTEATVQDYIDRLTATARAQGKDRFFTFITSIAEEDRLRTSGATAGFGIRLSLDGQRLFIAEAFEGAPALAAGIDRGTEIVAIGTTSANARLISEILATEGQAGLNAALGPSTAGTARFLRFRDAAGNVREATVTKADFALRPVSSRYGVKIIDDGGKRVGYLNLRTFSIEAANDQLREAFAQFRAQNVTEVVIDFRYNGGGLVSIANLMGDLLGRDRATTDVFSFTTFRPELSRNNSTRFFQPEPQSIAPTKIAFIGTGATASASELVINAFVPYLRNRAALIGTNTFGKPVGQSGIDKPAPGCDDRLRVVTFATLNAERKGDYFRGLATTMEATCQAGDDLTKPLGDPLEASTRTALDFLAGRSCTPISATAVAKEGLSASLSAVGFSEMQLLTPDRPSVVQREVPGAY